MRFVTPKNEAQQCLSALHRVRESLVRDRTKTSNQIHGFLLEFGISLADRPCRHPAPACRAGRASSASRLVQVLERLHAHYKYLDEQIAEIDKELARQLAEDDLGQRLMEVPASGRLRPALLAAEMGDGKQYRCGRDFAAALGLVPRQYSTGGKANLLGISKRGDKHLRRLLVLVRPSLHAAPGHANAGPLAHWVRDNAGTPAQQCRGLRTGQQASPHRHGPLPPNTRRSKQERPSCLA